MQTHIDLAFADGEYRFALGLEQINALQNALGDGLGAIYARVLQGRMPNDPTVGHPGYAAYRYGDLIETIRQGLIGGGQGMVDKQPVTVSAMRANQLVEDYALAPSVPVADLWSLAAAILFAKIEGYKPAVEEAPEPDADTDDDKKKADGSTTQEPSPMA